MFYDFSGTHPVKQERLKPIEGTLVMSYIENHRTYLQESLFLFHICSPRYHPERWGAAPPY